MAAVFLGVLLIVVVYVFYLKNEVRKLTKRIAKIPFESQHGSRLYSNFHEKELIALVTQINTMIDQYERNNGQLRMMREKLKYSITGLSHDLRTPLTAVKGYLELLEKTDDSQKKEEYIRAIKQSVSRLETMTDSFYEVAKVEMDQREVQKQTVNFYRLVQETFLGFYEQFAAAEVEVVFPDHVEDVQIKADPALLTRVIENLIQNCLRYAEKEVRIAFDKGAGRTTIRIENDVKPGQLLDAERVFDLFYTGNYPRTNTKSSGVGLHVAKKLVEQLDGELSASSKEGTFSITIAFHYD